MAHKTLIGGTAYNIVGGKTKVGGTAYNISKGRTLVGGTGYDIEFAPNPYAMFYQNTSNASEFDVVFQLGDEADESRTLSGSYTGFVDSTNSVPPWNGKQRNIVNIKFDTEIAPKSMSNWFNNSGNMVVNLDTMTNLNLELTTNMAYTYQHCRNLTGSPVCGKNVTNMVNTYYNCHNLTGSPVCREKVPSMASTYCNCHNLTGSPVCGERVTDMSATYRNCYNLTGSPVCGEKVTRMDYTYLNCRNLTGSPVCGENVTNMDYTYQHCRNLTGSPVCGKNVDIIAYTYYNCHNLTGSPVCGENVTNMAYTYYSCHNLTGSPVCGEKVDNMAYTYYNCYNLIGSPVCGEKVAKMISTYSNCYNLTGSPVCGENVISMAQTYCNCHNLTGSPVCREKVDSMYHTYRNCRNLTGSPVCGEKVTDMAYTYQNCRNLTGSPVCGENVTGMAYTYSNCYNLHGNFYMFSDKVTSIVHCFNGRNTSNMLNIFVNTGTTSNTTVHISNTYSLVGTIITYTDAGSYQYNTAHNIYIYPVSNVSALYNLHQSGGIYLEQPKDIRIEPNTSHTYTVPYLVMDTSVTTTLTVTSSDNSIVTISDVITSETDFTFTVTSNAIEDEVTLTLTMTQGDLTQTKTCVITVKTVVTETTIEHVAGYEFELNEDGYYESSNNGINNSYSLCKVNITVSGNPMMYLDCINSGENNFDFGILSNLDTTLSSSYSVDSSNVFKSFKGLSSTNVQTVSYGVIPDGEHFIYVKYRKDSSGASGNDSLQFKVRFE